MSSSSRCQTEPKHLSSIIFRQMIETAHASRIELTDPNFEDEATIERLLELIIDGSVDWDSGIPTIMDVVTLAKKYAFDMAMERLVLQIRCDLSEQDELASQALAIGMALDDLKLCTTALNVENGRWRELNKKEKLRFGHFLPRGRLQDPASMPIEEFCCFDHETLWAWSRAYRVAFGPYDVYFVEEDEQLKMMSDEFARLMKLKGELSHLGRFLEPEIV